MKINIYGNNKRSNKRAYAKSVALLGVIAAFAAILSYVEVLMSFSIWIPGAKLGFANIAIVIVLYLCGTKEAFFVNIVRIFIVGLLFGNMFSILFSLSGAFISLLFMSIAKRTGFFSIIGVSVIGGVTHNLGQILVAVFVVDSYSVIYYMPILIIAGILTGIFIGFVAGLLIKYIGKVFNKL